jgi:hypothetical protein
MKSGNGAQVALRTSAAVLAMLWLGHAAVAQDAEDGFDAGDEIVDITVDPIEVGEDWVAVDGEEPTEEIVVYDSEELLSDGIGDGVPLDDDVLNGEGDGAPSDDGATEEEPVFVSTCGGCELEFGVGGPEVQRDDTPVVLHTGSDSEVLAASSNACDSGWLSTAWICTVQNGSWRD